MNTFYVYVLLDTSKPGKYYYGEFEFDYEPFYIGKGKSNRIKNTLYDNSPFKQKKINKLISEGYEIMSIKILENLSNEKALQKEIEIISLIGRRDLKKGPLVNLTNGGDGRLKSKHSQETKNKISKSRKGKGIGWKHTQKTLKLMSKNQSGEKNGFYGKNHTRTVKSEQSKRVSGNSHPFFNKKHDTETLGKLKKHRNENISNEILKESCQKFNKPVLMFDLNFNFISEFESVKEASLKTKINESIISKCCRGDIKNPTRYFFKYKYRKDNIKNNKFLICIGDKFILNNKIIKLVKRNVKTCICEVDGLDVNLHKDDYPILFEKESNNINIIELYMFLKKIDNSFKLKKNIIKNYKFKIKFIKILKNSDLFTDNKEYILVLEEDWILRKKEIKLILLSKINRKFQGNSII